MTEAAESGPGGTVNSVEFYWRPGCPYCMRLRHQLKRSGLPVHAVNIWKDPEAAARVRSVADGNETVPTVFVGPAAMVNPSIDQLRAAVAEHAPHLIEQSAERPGGLRGLLSRWL